MIKLSRMFDSPGPRMYPHLSRASACEPEPMPLARDLRKSLRSTDRYGHQEPSRHRPSDQRAGPVARGRHRGGAGGLADHRGGGLLAVRGAVDDLASLVDRSAAAA